MKRLNVFVLVLLIFLGFEMDIYAQSEMNFHPEPELDLFISSTIGVQMSGIKSEDFVKSNYSPLVNFSIGKWFSPELALQFGYRGTYFNTISDEVRHNFNYVFAEVLLDLENIILGREKISNYKVFLNIGSGYFYNFNYGQSNICATLGLSNNLLLSKYLVVKFDISAIMGWDIYQGDEDILPGLSTGLSYRF